MSSNQASFGLYRPFTGTVKVKDTDPLFPQLEEGKVIRLSYRGKWLDAFRVETVEVETADGGLTKTASGRGAMAFLEDALVWYDTGNPATEREFTDTYAGILLTLLSEAQTRGVFDVPIVATFTPNEDSEGKPISGGTVTIRLQVGSTLLDYVRSMWERGIWIRARWNFEQGQVALDWAEPPYGADLTGGVRFRLQQARQHKREKDATYLTTVLLVKNGDAFLEVKDDTAIATWGRRERMLTLDNAGSNAEAQALASEILAKDTEPRQAITLEVEDLDDGPRVFIDYNLGDIVAVYMPDTEQWEHWRVVGFTLDFQDHGRAKVALELNHEPPDYDLAQARMVQRAALGRQNEVAYQQDPTEKQKAHEADALAHRNLTLGDTGGDVVGTATSATVVGLQGVPVSATQPSIGQVLKFDGTQWTPGTDETGSGGGGGGGLLDTLLLGRPIVTPSMAQGWQWFNQGNATIAETARGLELFSPGYSNYNLMGVELDAPPPPYIVTAFVVYDVMWNTNYMGGGIGRRDIGTNRVEYMRYTQGRNQLQVLWANSPTSHNSTRKGLDMGGIMTRFFWMQFEDDGTNLYWRFSFTGNTWAEIYSQSRTAFLANPDKIVFLINPEEAFTIQVTLASFEIT